MAHSYGADSKTLVESFRKMDRALARVQAERDDLKNYLISLKKFFEKGYDPEDEHFCQDEARDGVMVEGHWAANLIQEIDLMTADDVQYVPFEPDDPPQPPWAGPVEDSFEKGLRLQAEQKEKEAK